MKTILKVSILFLLLSLICFAQGHWTKFGDMPERRYAHTVDEIDGKVYVIGGAIDEGSAYPTHSLVYDLSSGEWSQLNLYNNSVRATHSSCVVDGKLYIVGGHHDELKSIATMEMFDPDSGKWVSKTPMPTARGLAACVAVDDKIYVIGGMKVDSTNWAGFNKVEVYDTKNDTWTQAANMPSKRWGLSATAANGKIYVFGGRSTGDPYGSIEVYDIQTNTWTTSSKNMPTPRYCLTTCLLDSNIYTIGGWFNSSGGPMYDKVEVYNPRNNEWYNDTPIPVAICAPSIVIDDKIYLYGGTNTTHPNLGTSAIYEFSQTNIPAGNVSGTWTLANSPYQINGDITIPNDSTLTIEPGVDVVFMGHHTMFVQGRLLAIGTETNNITFTINDTTGFYNPDSLSGGWNGIRFNHTPIQNDTSKIIYCILQYSKALGTDWTMNAGGAVSIIDFNKVDISNSTLSNCSATGSGGGIYIRQSELKINDSEFKNNIAASGGAIAGLNSTLSVSNCLFSQNQAITNSGAIDFDLDTLTSPVCQFNSINSSFIENSAGQYYGAIKIFQPDSGVSLVNVFIDKCEFENNTANRSGAIRLDGNISDFVISNSLFSKNSANTQSACTFWRGASGKIYNCLFNSNIAQNGLGSIVLNANCNVDLINCTIVNNQSVTSGGFTVHQKSSSKLINNIFWGNYPDQISLQSLNDASVSSLYLNYNDIQYGIDSIHIDTLSVLNWGVGNIDSDPLFQDTLNGDFHLQNFSSCIGAGIDAIEIAGIWYHCPLTDIEGNPRPSPAGSMPDIGAHENLLGEIVDVDKELAHKSEFALYENYPNPFNPSTTIKYSIPNQSLVTLKVFDILGREIETLINEEKTAGIYEIDFDASQLSSGIYFYKIQAGDFVETKKMILLK